MNNLIKLLGFILFCFALLADASEAKRILIVASNLEDMGDA